MVSINPMYTVKGIAQGNDRSTRIGNNILLKNVTVEYMITASTAPTSVSYYSVWYVYCREGVLPLT